jgi:hypothetical protein
MATDYGKTREARGTAYDASAAGYVIGTLVVLMIVAILYFALRDPPISLDTAPVNATQRQPSEPVQAGHAPSARLP